MGHVNLKELVGKLNETCRRSLEAAAGFCLSRTNYNVEIEHWLLKLMEMPHTDIDAIFHQFGVDSSRLTADLTRVMDGFKTGNSRAPALSPNVVDLVREAWLTCSIDYNETATRSGHLLLALLSDDSLARIARAASDEFDKISPETLQQQFSEIVANTEEASQAERAATAAAAEGVHPANRAPPKHPPWISTRST